MTDDHSINIGGNVTNAQVGQTLTNCTNLIQQQAPGERKDLLEELEKQVQQLLEALPAEKQEEAAGNLELAGEGGDEREAKPLVVFCLNGGAAGSSEVCGGLQREHRRDDQEPG